MAKKDKAVVFDKTGDVAGMWLIDGKKARQEFGDSRYWEGIDKIVDIYKDLHPVEFDAVVEDNVRTRLNNKNEFGSNDSKSTRLVLNIPHGLYLALTDYDPRLFRSKKTRELFMKRFNALRACDTV